MQLSEILETVLSKVTINKQLQISILGVPIFEEYLLEGKNELKLKEAKKKLALHIYENVYLDKQKITIASEISSTQLLKFNKNKKTWVKSCKVIFVDEDESLIVEKKQFRKRVYKGQYIRKTNFFDAVKKNDIVDVYFPDNNFNDKKSYLIFFGNQFYENISPELFRFYFNINIDGMCHLINLLSLELKQIKAPYEIKCNVLQDGFQRTDNLVVYVGKVLNEIVFKIIEDNYDDIGKYLSPKVPLFSKKIMSGIGFAENPNFTNESFGMSRCVVIADTMVEGLSQSNISLKNYVFQNLIAKGFNENNFYLNPSV